MIFFFYHGDIVNNEKEIANDTPAVHETHLVLYAKIYAIAEKYNVASMKDVALDYFEQSMKGGWASAFFAPAIHVVYASVPETVRGLKDISANAAIEHRRILLEIPAVQVLLKEVPDFAFDVLMCIRDQEKAKAKYDPTEPEAFDFPLSPPSPVFVWN